MSAPVDVRQWIGDERFMYEPGTESRAKCDEVFTAVSELIEKVDELLSTHGEYRGYGGAGEAIEEHMRAELVLAIARVKGGAA